MARRPSPLVADIDVLQLGDRETRDPDYAWPDIARTAITRIDIFEALALGAPALGARIAAFLAARPRHALWIHLDLDVLDRSVLPAVDTPGSPGLPPEDLLAVLRPLVAAPSCRGMTLTIFDPDLDPTGLYASRIVALIRQLPFPRRNAPPATPSDDPAP